MSLEPQAAIESAVLRSIRSIPGGRFTTKNSDRMYNGEPPPASGPFFVAVWSGGGRQSTSDTSLTEVFRLAVTVTIRAEKPWDRWLAMRDELERMLNLVRAVVHVDCLNNKIQREASALMAADGTDQRVGFRDRLMLEGFDDAQHVGCDWFKADPENSGPGDAGLAQTARFGGLTLKQALVTME